MLRAAAVVGMVLALGLAGAPAASAATEVGDECAGNEASGTYSLVPEARASSVGLPLAAPVDGVVTAWKVNSAHAAPATEVMAAFRPTSEAGKFQAVGESATETVNQGLDVFPARMPVQAGDRFGLVGDGENSPLFCLTGNSGDHTWSLPFGVGLGSTHFFAAGQQVLVPLVAKVEPDQDGDGYGDETQDKCPQSALYQGPCPIVALDAFPIVLKRSVLVLVDSSETAAVQVFGQVSWKVRQPGGAHSSKASPVGKVTGLTVGLTGGAQTVKAGEIGRFTVKLPKSVKRRLGRIPPSHSLKGTITARTTDIAGGSVERTIAIRLPGQEKAGK